MGQYIVVSQIADAPEAHRRSAQLALDAAARGFNVRHLTARTWLASSPPRPPGFVTAGPWFLIGDVLNRLSRTLDPLTDVEPHSYEKKLLARFWGRFVGVRLNGAGVVNAALRDPSGALECVTCQDDDLIIVASDFPAWLVQGLSPEWRINFARVGQALLSPTTVWNDLLLDGPCTVIPGALLPLPTLDATCIPLWLPAAFARRGDRQHLDVDAVTKVLRNVIDETVASYSALASTIACEVSGGLDSSVVAASLALASPERVKAWLNAFGEEFGSDERAYVHDLESHLGIDATAVPRGQGPITEGVLREISQHVRPGLNALDWHHDEVWAEMFRRTGVEAVMTGKGGDSVMIQALTADVIADRYMAHGWRGLIAPDLAKIARLNECSVWSLIREARARLVATPGRPRKTVNDVTPGRPTNDHPWMRDLSDLGPSKIHQIAGILNGVSFSAPSAQTAVVDLFHPLLAQPVVEVCLSLSTTQLTLGARDRGLVRRAFQGRLPPSIFNRRSKGDMTAFYGRMIAANLDMLRPWLLDGRLAAEGLIDRQAFESLLNSESLIWRGGYAEIIVTAAIEGWVREWEDRLKR